MKNCKRIRSAQEWDGFGGAGMGAATKARKGQESMAGHRGGEVAVSLREGNYKTSKNTEKKTSRSERDAELSGRKCL